MNELEKALAARNKFLEDHPELQSYQNEIDSVMEKVGDDPATRLEAIAQMVEGQMLRLQFTISTLAQTFEGNNNDSEA
jgi:hypothetical protein